MKCLMKYQWVKLPRNHLPEGKGIMSAWAKLASRAAFRKGQASYCGHISGLQILFAHHYLRHTLVISASITASL